MSTKNPLKRIYELDQKIAEKLAYIEEVTAPLREEVEELQAERKECFEYAMKKRIYEQGKYVMQTIVKTGRSSRKPRVDDVLAKLKEKFGAKSYQAKAIEIAKFEIKALRTVFSEDEIDSVCDVSQSTTEERIITMRD